MEKWTFYLETYGCKVNQYESEALREAWKDLGGEECNNPALAQYIVINSCAITNRAERDARNAIYRLRRESAGAKIILCGCAAQFFGNFIPRKNAIYSKPDLIIAQKDKQKLLSGFHFSESPPNPRLGINMYSRARAVVLIQDGCSHNCSYCIVPQTRSKVVSRSPQTILEECLRLLENDFCEIILSGVNLRLYGKDQPAYGDFWDLLDFLHKSLIAYEGKARLRISSLDPAQLTGKARDILLSTTLLCPHLHLSLQHASPQILKHMRRDHYSPDDICQFIQELRIYWPQMGLGLDIIAGFPGESEADLLLLLEFLQELKPSYAHVFPYSARPGTLAASLPNQQTRRKKQERADIIRKKVEIFKQEFFHKQLLLPEMTVAREEKITGDGLLRGVNEYYTPCFLDAKIDNQKLIKVKPMRIGEKGLEVEKI